MATTKKANLVVSEVWADEVQAEFKGKLIMGDFAFTEDSLEGQAGDTVNFPIFNAITDANDLTEGTAMETEVLTAKNSKATIKEVGKAVEISDSAQISAVGDPIAEAKRQVAIVVARKIDTDMVNEVITNCPSDRQIKTGSTFAEKVALAKSKWGDEPEKVSALLVNSTKYTSLLTDAMFIDNTKYNSDVLLRGEVGRILGVPVLLTDKIPANKSIMIEKGALAYITKRQPNVETDRDILSRTTVIATNVHYAVKLVKENAVAVIDETA